MLNKQTVFYQQALNDLHFDKERMNVLPTQPFNCLNKRQKIVIDGHHNTSIHFEYFISELT